MAFQIKAKEFKNLEEAERFANEFCLNHKNVIYVELKVSQTPDTKYLVAIQYQI